MNEYSVEYILENLDERICKSMEKALKPEAAGVPEGVNVVVECNGEAFLLKMSSSEINILRALHNSFIGLIAMLLEMSEGFVNEQENTSTRGSTINSSVSNSKGNTR